MAKPKISKTSVNSGSKAERPRGTFLTQKESEKTIPLKRGEFQQLQAAWFAIGDMAELLKEVRCETVTNPYAVLRILNTELGKVITDLEFQFEKQAG